MSQNANPKWLKRLSLAGAVVFVMLFTPLTALAQPPSPLRPGSGAARDVADLFWIVTGVAAVVFVVVEALLIFAVIRYRRRFPDETPEQIEGNTRLEVIWTIIPALILLALFGLTLRVLQVQYNAPADAFVVEVTGHQWFWEFNYPETEVTVNSRSDDLYLPADEPVVLEIRSNDVIHSFWVPELSGKMDAIPGHTNTLWFEPEEGTYAGECAEFCGLEHYAMLFDVQVIPREEFDGWMDEQIELASQFQPIGTDMETPLPEGDPANGEALFTELGCESCHSLDGTQIVGPTLMNMGERAGEQVEGMAAEAYLREAVVDPCAHVMEGFTCVMPQNFGERLEAQGLADLIAYLQEQ